MKKEVSKDNTNAPPLQGDIQQVAVEHKQISVDNAAKSSMQFLWGEVMFTNESEKYRAYVITLVIIGTIAIIWLLKEWVIIGAIYKKVSALNIRALFSKGKFNW